MEVLRTVADDTTSPVSCTKPYAGVNGSGKHTNWAIRNERGNLLSQVQRLKTTSALFHY